MRTLAFTVVSIIAAMIFTLDTAEAHWRPTTRIWRCPPAFFRPNIPGGLIGLCVSGAIGGTDTGISIVFSSLAHHDQRHRFAEIVMPLPFRQLSNHTPRYFGKFPSRTEAEKWIEVTSLAD